MPIISKTQSKNRAAYAQLMALHYKANDCMAMLSMSAAVESDDRIKAAKELVKLMRQRRKLVHNIMTGRKGIRALLRRWL